MDDQTAASSWETNNPADILHRRARDEPGRTAFIAGGENWTYRRLAGEAGRLATAMRARGVQPGDRVALHMVNLPELAVAYFACFHAGAVAAPLNVRLKTEELRSLLRQLQPALYLGQAELYPLVAPLELEVLAMAARFVVDAATDDGVMSWASLLAEAKAHEMLSPHQFLSDDPALLVATSGTTGRSKLVIHTPATLSAIAASFAHLDLSREQTVLVMLPMVHGAAFTILFSAIHLGAPMVLLERFDPDAALNAIRDHKCSWTMGVPPMFAELLHRQGERSRDVGSLRCCLVVGDVCPPSLQEVFPSVFGVALRTLLGSSEAVWSLTYGLQPGPVSRIAPGTEVRLVDDAGEAVARGEVGEMLLRSASVMPGYWDGPGRVEGTPENGWCRTGDLMRQGSGDDLWFVGRKKDLIVRGGSNISPVEVEQALLAHPAVRDAAAVGVPDPVLGERVAALVQLDRPGDVDDLVLRELLSDVSARLADYKTPERLRAVDAIPRNVMGKLDRAAAQALLTSADIAADRLGGEVIS